MGSIAYVTDEKMLAYHRLCRNQSILFWRLSNKKFTDFHKGDLLFFFARPNHGRKKALIGYAHYDSEEAKEHKPQVVFVDEENKISRVTNYEKHGLLKDLA